MIKNNKDYTQWTINNLGEIIESLQEWVEILTGSNQELIDKNIVLKRELEEKEQESVLLLQKKISVFSTRIEKLKYRLEAKEGIIQTLVESIDYLSEENIELKERILLKDIEELSNEVDSAVKDLSDSIIKMYNFFK